MKLQKLYHHSISVFRFRYFHNLLNLIRKQIYSIMGMRIGKGTNIPKLYVTWPFIVSIGNQCKLEQDIYFKNNCIWSEGQSIIIGDDVFIGKGCEFNIKGYVEIDTNCFIAFGVRFVDQYHSIELYILMKDQDCPSSKIIYSCCNA